MTRLYCSLLLLAFGFASLSVAQTPYKTRNLILVTGDGIRWQEVFRGIDPALMNREDAGMKNGASVRRRFQAESRNERRRKLFPFLWSVVADEGLLLGNRDLGSEVNVRNRHRFSYPGYSEILVGRPQDDRVDSNALQPNPSRTVLEILRQEWDLSRDRVALFASWEIFRGIGAQRSGDVLINAGYQPLTTSSGTGRMAKLSAAQFEALTPWNGSRHDYFTLEMALEHLAEAKPRVLYVAFDETDDWAHNHRYDRTLEAANYFDSGLRRLWQAVQADKEYRDTTTLIVTTDHGRGPGPKDWHGHGAKVKGAEQIWIAAIGPDTPAQGELSRTEPVTQSDIAPTMLELAGIDPGELGNDAGRPIALITGR